MLNFKFSIKDSTVYNIVVPELLDCDYGDLFKIKKCHEKVELYKQQIMK